MSEPRETEAVYYDGVTPLASPGVLRFEGERLHFFTIGEHPQMFSWRCADIVEIDSSAGVSRLLIGRAEPGQQRPMIRFNDAILAGDLEAVWRRGRGGRFQALVAGFRGWSRTAQALTWLSLLALGVGGYFFAGDHAHVLLTRGMEKRLGDAMSVYLIKEYGVLADEASNTWLEQMGRRFSARTGSPVKILILDNRMLNAFTLPGGRIFVCRGLLEQAGSAEEVAGVLAHEMAHDGRRHPLRQLIRTLGTVLVFQLAIGDGFEGLEVAEAVAEMGSLVLALKYSRDFEREADRDAIGMLQQEGISLRGLRDFFERVDGKELNADALKYLGTHPSGAERLAMVGEALAKQGPTTPLALVGVPWKVQPKIEPETIRPGTP